MVLGRDKPPARRHMMVVSRTPVRRLLSVVAVAGTVAAAALAGYLLGVRQSGVDRDHLEYIEGRAGVLELELEGANRQLADANLGREVDRRALAIHRDEMTELRATVGQLREQLAFYRRLMDGSSPESNLQIADFELIGAEGTDSYRFRVLLTRPTEDGERIRGHLKLEVAGLRAGREQVLALPEISDMGRYPLEFRFRYFQRLSGSLKLPDDFLPLRVTVRLTSRGEGATRVERTFAWPATLTRILHQAAQRATENTLSSHATNLFSSLVPVINRAGHALAGLLPACASVLPQP